MVCIPCKNSLDIFLLVFQEHFECEPPGGDTPYNGLYGEAPPERGTLFRLQVYKRVGFHELNYMKGQENLSFRYLKGPLIIE